MARTQRIAERILAHVWEPLDAALLARTTGIPDDAPGEADVYGHGIVFPHVLARGKIPFEDVEASPLSDEIVLETALAAIEHEQLGADPVPDLLLVSLSAHDAIAHTWGQESWEALDELLRLDRQIGRLLDELDERVGAGRWAVVLATDHGAAHTVEHSRAKGRPAKRVNPTAVEQAAEDAAASIAGAGDWIAYAKDPTLYLSEAARGLPPERRDALLDAVTLAVSRIDGVGYAARSDRITGDCDGRPEVEALMCRSVDPERSGEVYYGPRADSIIMLPPDEATAHGSANPDDRTVPIVIHAPGLVPRQVEEPSSVLRVAATVAKLLGVPPPAAAQRPSL